MIHFYDSASPQNIPSGVHAAVYINGYAWPDEEILRMASVFRVSVLREASFARWASCIDVETAAATPADAVAFCRERRELGFNDPKCYVNRSNWSTVKAAIADARLAEPLWWVATLDGTQDIEGAWAVQYQGGPTSAFDLSVLKGRNEFHRPGVDHGPYGT